MKNTQPKRDWTAAREKVEAEGVCRAGHHICVGKLEAAHIIGRDRDQFTVGPPWPTTEGPYMLMPGGKWPVEPIRVVPLCTWAHRAYDAHELDLLGCLTPEEEAQAVLDAGGLEAARRRLCPSEYRSGPVL